MRDPYQTPHGVYINGGLNQRLQYHRVINSLVVVPGKEAEDTGMVLLSTWQPSIKTWSGRGLAAKPSSILYLEDTKAKCLVLLRKKYSAQNGESIVLFRDFLIGTVLPTLISFELSASSSPSDKRGCTLMGYTIDFCWFFFFLLQQNLSDYMYKTTNRMNVQTEQQRKRRRKKERKKKKLKPSQKSLPRFGRNKCSRLVWI